MPSAGSAYIDIEPRLDGLKRELTRKLNPIARQAGRSVSEGVGRGAASGSRQLDRFGREANQAAAASTRLSRTTARVGGTLRQGSRDAERHGRGLRLIGRGAAYALGAGGFGGGLYAVFDVTKKSIEAFKESERVTRQTDAAIRSTGGSAKVSAGHVQTLANRIAEKTGIDDEAIQTSSNLLLTFTGVRNEVGRGNKVFDRSTKSIVDMATAMNHGATPSTSDLHSATLQLGKALQDPVKGMGALRRVGVAFDADQQKQIKSLVAHGHQLEAQKMILRELTKEFGGSAAKQATSGKRLSVTLGNLAESFGRALNPSIQRGAHDLEAEINDLTASYRRLRKEGRSEGEAFGILAEREVNKVTDAFAKAAPHMAEDAAKTAPKVAGAFVHGFTHANVWGKLAIGGLIAAKVGPSVGRLLLGGRGFGGGLIGGGGGGLLGNKPVPVFVVNQGAGGLPGGKGKGLPPILTGGSRAGRFLGRAGAVGGLAYGGFQGVQQVRDLAGGNFGSIAKRAVTSNPITGVPARLAFAVGGLFGGGSEKKPLSEAEKLRRAVSRVIGKPVKLRVDVDPAQVKRDTKVLQTNMNRLKNHLATSTGDIRKITKQDLRIMARDMDLHSKEGRRAVEKHMGLTLRAIKDDLGSGDITTRQAMRAIRRSFEVHTKASKGTAQENFNLAAKAIRDAMGSGKKATEQGNREIARLFRVYLGQFGIKGRDAEVYLKQQKDPTGGSGSRGHAKGGLVQFGRPGEAGRDTIPAQFGAQKVAVGAGEVGAVFNRHQLPVLNARLSDLGGLPGFFQKFNRPHYMAQGGLVPRVGRIADRIQSMFHPDSIGGYRPEDGFGEHSTGRAIDIMIGSNTAKGNQIASWLYRNAGPLGLKWEIWRQRIRHPGSDWRAMGDRGSPTQNHMDHVHAFFEAMGGGGKLSGAGAVAMKKIKRMIVGGPDSPMKAGVQAGLDRVRERANKRLRDAYEATAGDPGSPTVGGSYHGPLNRVFPQNAGTTISDHQAAQLLRRAGFPEGVIPTFIKIMHRESSNQPGVVNSIGATGLWQIYNHPDLVAKYGNMRNPWNNVRAAFDLSGGGKNLHPWDASGPYAKGGIVGAIAAAQGLLVGRGRGRHRLGLVPSAKEIRDQEAAVEKLDGKKVPKDKKKAAKLKHDLDSARRQLKSMKSRRRKGLGKRQRNVGKLSERIKKMGLAPAVVKDIAKIENQLQDLSDSYDQDEADYRSDDVLSKPELDDLVAKKTRIRDLIGGAKLGEGGEIAGYQQYLIPLVTKKIGQVSAFIERLKARVRANNKAIERKQRRIDRIRREVKRINEEAGKAHKLKDPKTRRARLERLGKQKGTLTAELSRITQREIPAIEADNLAIAGERRPRTLAGGEQGVNAESALLPQARTLLGATDDTDGPSLRGYLAAFGEKLRPGGLQSEWKSHNLAISALLREGATKPADDSQKAELTKQLLDQANLRTSVSEAHFNVFRNLGSLPPFAGRFHEGGVVPGPKGAERYALVQAGERISPEDAEANVRVVLEDNRSLVYVNDRLVREIVHDENRRIANTVGRTPGRAGTLG